MTLRYASVAVQRKREAIECLPKWSWHKVGAPDGEIC